MTAPREDLDDAGDAYAAARSGIEAAPLPLPATVRRRSSLPVQAWRFAVINVKILQMVRKGHE